MDTLLQKATVGESKSFYGIDRELFTILVIDLLRNPLECLQIMGLWLWLERLGISQVIRKVRSMPMSIIDILADEAVTFLKLMNISAKPSIDKDEVPFTNNILLKKFVSLQFFINYQDIIIKKIHDIVIEEYIPALADIVEKSTQSTWTKPVPVAAAASSSSPSNPPGAPGPTYYTDPFSLNFFALSIKGDAATSSSSSPSNPPRAPDTSYYTNPFDLGFSALSIKGDGCNRAPTSYVSPKAVNISAPSIQGDAKARTRTLPQNRAQRSNTSEYSRPVLTRRQSNISEYTQRVLAHQTHTLEHSKTMFATFSKGYPVSDAEVREFFTALYGECIQGLHMQEVTGAEQPLYARIVFANRSVVEAILNGQGRAKFTINGKHVWIRRFVPRNGKPLCAPGWIPPRQRQRDTTQLRRRQPLRY